MLVSYRRGGKDKRQEKGQGERQGSSDRVPLGKDLPAGKRQLSDTEGVPPFFLNLCLSVGVCGVHKATLRLFSLHMLFVLLPTLVLIFSRCRYISPALIDRPTINTTETSTLGNEGPTRPCEDKVLCAVNLEYVRAQREAEHSVWLPLLSWLLFGDRQ